MTKQWYRLDEESEGQPAWQMLGHRNVECLRHWLRVGRKAGWLKPGKHFKLLVPNRKKSPILVHLERCQEIGTK